MTIYTGPHYHAVRNWENGKMYTHPVDGELIVEETKHTVWKCGQCKYISNTEKSAIRHFEKYHTGPADVKLVEEVTRRVVGTKVEESQ